ncbi:MAG: hypothetical protein QXU42_06865 [Thermoproteota archaeon]
MVAVLNVETTGLDPYENQVILMRYEEGIGKIRRWKLWKIGDEAEMILLAMEEKIMKISEF